MKRLTFAAIISVSTCCLSLGAVPAKGWLAWRGPQQNGTSLEKNLPGKLDPKNPLWRVDFPGQSTPVIANGHVYIMGYLGEGPDLQEGISCFDAETGKLLWEKRYNDFLSDTIYLRYATSSPAVDPETGNVYMQGTQGILAALTAAGKLLWQHSMMEKFGRLTFPNSRTASPIIDGNLVITRGITANWGKDGPAGMARNQVTQEILLHVNQGGGHFSRPREPGARSRAGLHLVAPPGNTAPLGRLQTLRIASSSVAPV